MHRFVTCCHCEKPFRVRYRIKRHYVQPVPVLPCPHCRQQVPHPRPADIPAGAFFTCRIIPESDDSALAARALAAKLRWAWLFFRKYLSPEWPVALGLAGILGVLGMLGWQPSDQASASAFFALPYLALVVIGVEKVRLRVSPEGRGALRMTLEVLGLFSALLLLLLVGLALARM